MRRVLTSLIVDSRGQDLIEYALLASFISLIAITAILNVGTALNGVWGDVSQQTQAAAAAAGGGGS